MARKSTASNTYKNQFNKKHGFPKDKSNSIKTIAKLSKIKYSNAQSVRKNVKSAQQWGVARLYSAVMGGKAARIDKDLLK